MERTKKVKKEPIEVKGTIDIVANASPLLRWKKVGGGSLRWKNHIIKPGQVFLASVEELPKSFLNSLECIDNIQEIKSEAIAQGTNEELYIIVSVGPEEVDNELFNVVNIATDKAINETPLTLEQAKELKTALEA